MPIIQNGNYYIYKQNVKNRQKTRKFSAILIFFLIILLVFCVFLTFTKINFTNMFNMNKYLIFEEKTYFGLSICSGEREEVLSNQTYIRANGGAGYVYNSGEKYFLIASIYQTENDANSVAEKLTDYQTEIVKFKLENLILSAEYTSEQLTTLKYVLNQVNRAVIEISKITTSFDRGEILEGEAKQKLQIFGTSCQQDKESLSNAFPSCCDNIIAHAKIFCNQTVSYVTSTNLSTNFSSDAKNLMIEIVVNFLDFQKNIKK